MTRAAFSYLAEAEGRILKTFHLLAEYLIQSRMLNLFKIRLNSILLPNLILILLIRFWSNHVEILCNDQLNHFFNHHGPCRALISLILLGDNNETAGVSTHFWVLPYLSSSWFCAFEDGGCFPKVFSSLDKNFWSSRQC